MIAINLSEIQQRFFRYVKIDTQSDPLSASQPSTSKQIDLLRVLQQELATMGVEQLELDPAGYIYATIPANSPTPCPTIFFCAHVDTSPDCPGAGVQPVLHPNYQGQTISLPQNPDVKIQPNQHPDLLQQIGNDIVTASGHTLLGADNKAGVTAIMMAVQYLLQNPSLPHGTIKILFTPDEEIGRGTAAINLDKIMADFGYTVDGESLGTIENETFSANAMTVNVYGVSAHPGFAKDKMQSAIKIAAEIVANLPNNIAPEYTEGMQGFVHPVAITGQVESTQIELIIRDFDEKGLELLQNTVKNIADGVLQKYLHAKVEYTITEQYRNMKQVLAAKPEVVQLAMQAMQQAGLQPQCRSIRGGTDGSRLSIMGLPCANIFAGEHAFHSKEEWVSLQDMAKAAEVIVRIAGLVAAG
jgi:tripeptide aminopeptidase